MSQQEKKIVSIVDYGVGNVRSVINAIESLGHETRLVKTAEDIFNAEKIVFPGVGNFAAVGRLEQMAIRSALISYIKADRPFLGICVGMQSLFEGSEESEDTPGLGIIPGKLRLFKGQDLTVPHMGWNGLTLQKDGSCIFDLRPKIGDDKVYFVHSYYAEVTEGNNEWMLTSTTYGPTRFISSIHKGNVVGVQFHPEKSGTVGLSILKAFLSVPASQPLRVGAVLSVPVGKKTLFTRRIIAALDVRSNDQGDLVVTKGDQYDVREKEPHQGQQKDGNVRNLGKPVELALRYFADGADEIAFLNITSFRNFPLKDTPMLELLRVTCQRVFVPITVGGGIRDFVDQNNRSYSALEVADEYFRSGADKISIGSDAVTAVEDYIASGRKKTGKTSIEQISRVYGAQAVVVSIDPKRVYVSSPSDTPHATIVTATPGPNGEKFCWYQCTIKGGREARDIGAVEVAIAVEELGAGEIMLNCIDRDGTNSGYDLELLAKVKSAVRIPIVASSGAGCPQHFVDMFAATNADAALAAGIFHRNEYSITAVKQFLALNHVDVRIV
jgi:imidazole glycerol-phosphate synthase